MSEPLVVVVIDDVVTQGIVATEQTVQEWREGGHLPDLFPGADLVDVSHLDPRPAIGWTRSARGWEPPPVPEEPAEVTA